MLTNERSQNWYGALDTVSGGQRELLSIIEPGMHVVDIGANEGFTTVLAGLTVGKKGQVIAVEPAAHNLQPLRLNLALNGLKEHVLVIAGAVSDSDVAVEMQGERVNPVGAVQANALTVKLDDLIGFRPDVIKLDCEGYEVKAIRGGLKLLEACKPTLFLESHLEPQGVDMRHYGDTPETLYKLLTDLGYDFYRNGQRCHQVVGGAMIVRHPEYKRMSHITRTMPKAFCMTMPGRTPDRAKAAEEHFKSVGLDVTFTRAVDGHAYELRTNKWSGDIQGGKPYYCSPGQLGLALSHRFIWELVWHLGLEEALILEDDALLPADFQDRFCQRYETLPADWQFVFVGAYDVDPANRINDHIVVDRSWRMHCYLIKRSAIPILLDTMESGEHHVDVLLRSNALPKLKHYTFWPSLAKQRTAEGHWASCAV